MNYRVLGRTGLRVSEIGFGCGNVGGLLVRGSSEEQLEAVSRALELGINYFDTAPAYGDGQSETNLGRVLAELYPEITLATKVRISNDDLKDIASTIKRSLETSLRRLQRDSVDILQLHTQVAMERGGGGWQAAISLDDVLGNKGVAETFAELRSQGLVHFFGFTGLGETEALHRVADSGLFDLVQAYYNLINPSAGMAVPSGFSSHDFRRLIDRVAEHDMGVAVIRVMAGGALGGAVARRGYASPTVGGPMVPGGEYEADEARAQKLIGLLSGDMKDLPQVAVRFALMHPAVSTVLGGFSDKKQIEEAAACSEKGPLPDEFMGQLKKLWAHNFEIE